MIIKTANSIYEINTRSQRFRRIHGGSAASTPPMGEWQSYERISPIQVGEPVRFFWMKQGDPTLSVMGFWATSPLVEILTDDEPAVDNRRVSGDFSPIR